MIIAIFHLPFSRWPIQSPKLGINTTRRGGIFPPEYHADDTMPAQVTTHIKITEIPGKWFEKKQRSISSDHSADINIPLVTRSGELFIYIYICSKICRSYLVGGIPTPLKNMSSSMGRIIPYIMENKTCLKPPTSVYIFADHTPGKIWHFNPLPLGPPCDGDDGHANFELAASCKMLAGTYAANLGSMDVCTYNEVWLVVDLPLWKIWKSIGIIIPNIWEKTSKCSKPPTRSVTTIKLRYQWIKHH